MFGGWRRYGENKKSPWNIQRGITTSQLEDYLLLLFSGQRLMTLYISTKFHEEILNGFEVIERTKNIAIWTLTLKCDLDLF